MPPGRPNPSVMALMTPERFRQIRNLFEAALEQDPAAREAFVSQAAASDEELLVEVRRMLDAHAHAAMLATFGSWGAACDMSLDGAERQGCAKQFRAVYGAAVRRETSRALTLAALPAGLQLEARALLGGRS